MAKRETGKHRSSYDICKDLGLMPLTPLQFEDHLDLCIDTDTAVYVEGHPGGGKTSIVRQVADRRGMLLVWRRLNGLDPTDMGFPYVYDDEFGIKRHSWTLPNFIYTEETMGSILEKYPNGVILFVDELPQAFPMMQNRFRECLEGYVNGVKISDKVKFVFAGNFASDKAATYPVPLQFINYVSAVGLVPDLESFQRYASTHPDKVHPVVAGYIRDFPDVLDSYDPDTRINATSRSLTECSKFIWKNVSMSTLLPALCSRIGEAHGPGLAAYVDKWHALDGKIERILLNPKKEPIPDEDETDIMCVLSAMIGRALDNKNAGALITYLQRMPAEFCVFALRDATRREPDLKKNCTPLRNWAVQYGDVLS